VSLPGQRIEAAVRALRRDDPTLAVAVGGHSLGGFVASSQRRDDIDSLVLLNSRTRGRATRPEVSGVAVYGARDGLISAQERAQTAAELPGVNSVVFDDLDHDFAQGLYGIQAGTQSHTAPHPTWSTASPTPSQLRCMQRLLRRKPEFVVEVERFIMDDMIFVATRTGSVCFRSSLHEL
jgi:pimeloyl-ACP methyl ester carboxylesterase